jgi:hypothetical protein
MSLIAGNLYQIQEMMLKILKKKRMFFLVPGRLKSNATLMVGSRNSKLVFVLGVTNKRKELITLRPGLL